MTQVYSIKEELHTQSNRMTSHPMFVVLADEGGRYPEFQDVFFTNKGAENYIEDNAHDLKDPTIYIKSGYKNSEWQAAREQLAGSDLTGRHEETPTEEFAGTKLILCARVELNVPKTIPLDWLLSKGTNADTLHELGVLSRLGKEILIDNFDPSTKEQALSFFNVTFPTEWFTLISGS